MSRHSAMKVRTRVLLGAKFRTRDRTRLLDVFPGTWDLVWDRVLIPVESSIAPLLDDGELWGRPENIVSSTRRVLEEINR